MEQKYNRLSKFIYKGMPILLSMSVYHFAWANLLSKNLKSMVYEYRTPATIIQSDTLFRVDNLMDWIVLMGLWIIIWAIILGSLYIGYRVIKIVWIVVCETVGIIKVEESVQVTKIVNKHKEQHSHINFISVNNIRTPVSSTYTDYYIQMLLGNEDSVELTESVSLEVYEKLNIGEEYRVKLEVKKIFGNSINYELSFQI